MLVLRVYVYERICYKMGSFSSVGVELFPLPLILMNGRCSYIDGGGGSSHGIV